MTGRVHRQPQKKPVLSIHLLGNETADVLVANMAEGKQDMMKAFLSKKEGQGELRILISSSLQFTSLLELYDLLSGGGGDMDDEEDESTSAISTNSRRDTTSSNPFNADEQETLSSAPGQSVSAHSANSVKVKRKSPLSDSSVNAPPQSVSSHSLEKASKAQAKEEKKARPKAEVEERAEERALAKAAKAEEKAMAKEEKARAKEEKARAKAAKAALKGSGKSARKGNPRFDLPEPSTSALNSSWKTTIPTHCPQTAKTLSHSVMLR